MRLRRFALRLPSPTPSLLNALYASYNRGQNKMEQLSPISPKAIMKVRRSKRAPFWHHWYGERGGSDVPFILSKIAILDRIKWNNYPPFPKAMMKARRSKSAPFWHHWNWGRGGPDVPFILSKIVVNDGQIYELFHINFTSDKLILSGCRLK